MGDFRKSWEVISDIVKLVNSANFWKKNYYFGVFRKSLEVINEIAKLVNNVLVSSNAAKIAGKRRRSQQKFLVKAQFTTRQKLLEK